MFQELKLAIERKIKLDDELWQQLQDFGQPRHVKKNEYILKIGEVCKHGYFISKGSMVQTFLNPKGKEVVQGFYIDTAYAFVSSVNSYYDKKASAFEIKAIEDCEIIEFSKSQLEFLATNYSEFANFYHQITTLGFQNLYMLSAMRLSLNAEEFLTFLYKDYPQYVQRIPDKYIAQFMGVSKEWLSKLKKKVLKAQF